MKVKPKPPVPADPQGPPPQGPELLETGRPTLMSTVAAKECLRLSSPRFYLKPFLQNVHQTTLWKDHNAQQNRLESKGGAGSGGVPSPSRFSCWKDSSKGTITRQQSDICPQPGSTGLAPSQSDVYVHFYGNKIHSQHQGAGPSCAPGDGCEGLVTSSIEAAGKRLTFLDEEENVLQGNRLDRSQEVGRFKETQFYFMLLPLKKVPWSDRKPVR